MNRMGRSLAGVLLTLWLLYPGLASASLDELLAGGHVSVDSYLSPGEGIVPGQRVALVLEIATDTWFTGGTRIGIPEIPGLVILQTEQFAANASENRDGRSWVVQRWTLDVFPQRAGDFSIGAIPLQVQVNAGSDGEVKGQLFSPPQHFSVFLPETLSTAKSWVAAPGFTVSQTFDRNLDELAVGDAFEQKIRFEASDVLAMMLPTYEVEPQPGLAAYPAPPQLENSNNRGQSMARRSIDISYTVEKPGEYQLGGRDYFWWNTTKGELELVSLPETRFTVAGAAIDTETHEANYPSLPVLLLAAACFVLLAIAALKLAHSPAARRLWSCLSGISRALARQWQALRKPALATRLNPDGSDED